MTIDFRKRTDSPLIIKLPNSKSLMIRYLMYYYVQKKTILPISDHEANDVLLVHRNLQILDKCRNLTDYVTIDVEDCGAAFRFFLPILATTPGNWMLTGTDRLLMRPITPLVEALQTIGADITVKKEGIFVTGKELHAAKMTIDSQKSSQFASALLLSSSKVGLEKLEIIPDNPPSSQYIEMTRSVMDGINKNTLSISDIEADWSSALFWYCYVALSPGSSVTLPNLKADSRQSDSIIAQWFEKLNVCTEFDGKSALLTNKKRVFADSRFEFDLRNNPDTAPLLSVLSICLQKSFILAGIENLNQKESRRSDTLKKKFKSFFPTQ